MGRVQGVGAEDLARAGDVQGHAAGEHRAGLHRRGVGAHDEVPVRRLPPARAGAVDVQGVLHLAGGVVDVEVEGVEVEPLVLDLGPLGDLPAHRDEEVGDLLHEGLQGVAGAEPLAPGGKRHINGLLDEGARLVGGGQGLVALLEGLRERAARPAEVLARRGALRGLEAADRAVRGDQGGALAQQCRSRGLELVEGLRGRDGGESRDADGVDCVRVEGVEVWGVASHVLLPCWGCCRRAPGADGPRARPCGLLVGAVRAAHTDPIVVLRPRGLLVTSTGALSCSRPPAAERAPNPPPPSSRSH